jgi:hypothetical protein
MTQALARIVADIAIFLQFSDEATIAPDASVGQFELLALRLQEMPESCRRELAEALETLGATEPDYQGFVRSLPDTLGFAT